MIYTCRHYRRQMTDVKVPRDAYVNVMGTDLVRLPDGQFVVLEDNLRVPSGVSYMLSSRKVMKQIFPALFRKYGVRPIEQYSQALLSTLRALAPDGRGRSDDRAADARRVQLGLLRARLPGAADGHRAGRRARPRRPRQHRLHADDEGAAARRRDLPPRRRRLPRSAGVPRRFSRWASPGLFSAYRAGNVTLANALGTGVADDKAIYAYVPKIIRYYLDQDPILANVETMLMTEMTASGSHVMRSAGGLRGQGGRRVRAATAC